MSQSLIEAKKRITDLKRLRKGGAAVSEGQSCNADVTRYANILA